MMKGSHGPTKLLHALIWDAFDYACHAPQVRACNYYVQLGSHPKSNLWSWRYCTVRPMVPLCHNLSVAIHYARA